MACALIILWAYICPWPAFPFPPDHTRLVQIIADYNCKVVEDSLKDGSNRGEVGPFRIGPEQAQSLGLKIYMDQDYIDSRLLFKKAEVFLESAQAAMASSDNGVSPEKHAEKIADYFLAYKEAMVVAKERLIAYHARLNPAADERLNHTATMALMKRLMEDSLQKNGYQLRDALGYFRNLCNGTHAGDDPLTPDNVRFVNHVFHRFTEESSDEELKPFDLDRDPGNHREIPAQHLEKAVGHEAAPHVRVLRVILEDIGHETYRVDPLLFMALMKRESGFQPLAISSMGAAGLTQIMPNTAIELGMKNIYMPDYFHEAMTYHMREREERQKAVEALFKIHEKGQSHDALMAWKLMQNALEFKRKRDRLFYRYKMELLMRPTDERLIPETAIRYGLRYFARLLEAQKGDISLALASYNAGPHRVREFNGIPPYKETVHFRNRVLEYYREYLKKAGESS